MTLVPYFEWDLSTMCMFASPVWGPWVVLLRVPLWFSMPLNVMLNVVRFQKCVIDWNDSDSRFVVNVPSVSYVADTACRVCGRVRATVQRLSVCLSRLSTIPAAWRPGLLLGSPWAGKISTIPSFGHFTLLRLICCCGPNRQEVLIDSSGCRCARHSAANARSVTFSAAVEGWLQTCCYCNCWSGTILHVLRWVIF